MLCKRHSQPSRNSVSNKTESQFTCWCETSHFTKLLTHWYLFHRVLLLSYRTEGNSNLPRQGLSCCSQTPWAVETSSQMFDLGMQRKVLRRPLAPHKNGPTSGGFTSHSCLFFHLWWKARISKNGYGWPGANIAFPQSVSVFDGKAFSIMGMSREQESMHQSFIRPLFICFTSKNLWLFNLVLCGNYQTNF